MSKNNNESKTSKITDYIIEKQMNEERINNVLLNPYYINWLVLCVQDKDIFSDDHLYSSDGIDADEKRNVEDLTFFYKGIDEYAAKNEIFPIKSAYGNYYRVKHNDNGIVLGMMMGQGTVFYAKKTEVDDGEDFIDFSDVSQDRKSIQQDQANLSLNILSYVINSMYENGEPVENIIETFNNTIERIKNNDSSKTRVRTK